MRSSLSLPTPLARAVPLLLAAAIAVTVYLVGRNVTPNYGTSLFGQTGVDTLSLKSWLATVVLGLAGFQLFAALWMHRRLPGFGEPPARLSLIHRLGGVTLILVTLPIAYHCMLAYGVRTSNPRVAVHSIAGSLLYGGIAAKITVVRSTRLPGWALPLAGGLLVALVVVLWYSSALWYLNGYSLPFPK